MSSEQVHLQAHQLMDRAQRLAEKTFEEQGLAELATHVRQSNAVVLPSEALTTQEVPSQDSDMTVATKVLRAVVFLTGVIPVFFMCVYMGMTAADYVFGEHSATTSAIPPVQQAIDSVRVIAATATTRQVEALAAGKDQMLDVNHYTNGGYSHMDQKMSASDFKVIQRLGAVSVVDREGRPELTWAKVSSDTCHQLVQDIYNAPSTYGVGVTVDGKSQGVSCAGPDHTIVFSPHL